MPCSKKVVYKSLYESYFQILTGTFPFSRNSCELTYISCKKYWDLREVSKVRVSGDIDSNIGNSVVSQGPCAQDCPGVELGMYTGWGLSRASNKGESEWRNSTR